MEPIQQRAGWERVSSCQSGVAGQLQPTVLGFTQPRIPQKEAFVVMQQTMDLQDKASRQVPAIDCHGPEEVSSYLQEALYLTKLFAVSGHGPVKSRGPP